VARPTDEHGDHAELELAHEAGLGDVVELVADHSLERDVGPQSVETLEQWAEPSGSNNVVASEIRPTSGIPVAMSVMVSWR